MKKAIFTLLCLLGIAAAIYVYIEAPLKKHIVTIKGSTLEVEVANNDYLRRQGLMGRSSLEDNKGMLFIFPAEAIQSFWMKNTLIPLSIAFIKEDGKISQITDMQPDRWDENLPTYPSQEKVKYALETNKGWFEKNNIHPGDSVKFSRSIQESKVEY